MTLLDNGWTEEQAQELISSLNLVGGPRYWKPEYRQKLHDWCSAHEKDQTTIEGQLDFIAYELRNSYQMIGNALDKAQTVEEAKEAVELFVRLISAGVRWLTADEAKAIAYQDSGNPELNR
jgi:Phage tail lysozyme